MISKQLVVALAVAYLILVSVVFLSDQVLRHIFPTVPISYLIIYRGIAFTIFLGAFIYSVTRISLRIIEKEKIGRENFEKDLQRQQSYVNILSQTITEMNSELAPAVVQEFVCKQMTSALEVNAATLTVYNAQTSMIELANAYGLPPEFSKNFRPVSFAANAAHLVAYDDPIVVFPGDKDLDDLPNSELYTRQKFGALAYLPLHTGDDFLGELVMVLFRAGDEFTSEQLFLFTTFGNQISATIRNSKLHADVQESRRKLDALRSGDLAILSSLDLDLTLRLFLQHVINELRADAADVLLLNNATQMLEYSAGLGFQSGRIKETRIQIGEGRAGKVALERRSIYLSDFHHEPSFTRNHLIEQEGFVTYFGVPLVAKGQLKGVLEVFHRSPFYPSDQWLSFLETLAGQSSIAIDNGSLYANLQHSNMDLMFAYDRTLEGWSRALDLRDHDTENHTRRVSDLCLRLAQTLNVSESELVNMRRGALLHDIGKMGVPDHILHKRGELSPEECKIMQNHPVYAFEMLSPISYLNSALDIPYCHHEKWDGSGYPRGLKGDTIPLAARIFAVVDVWDAMTSDRPYRSAVSNEEATQYIREQAGKHFDPKIVDTFLNMVL